jgi:hypothetical protein
VITHRRKQLCRAEKRDKVPITQPFSQLYPFVGFSRLGDATVLDIGRIEARKRRHDTFYPLIFQPWPILYVELRGME